MPVSCEITLLWGKRLWTGNAGIQLLGKESVEVYRNFILVPWMYVDFIQWHLYRGEINQKYCTDYHCNITNTQTQTTNTTQTQTHKL